MTQELTSPLNGQIVDTIHEVRAVVSSPAAAVETGSAKAFNFVAQATAMAIQDATDNLRNISTMSTTAIGVAMTQMLSSGDIQTWVRVLELAQDLVKQSTKDFETIGHKAAEVLSKFPPAQMIPPDNQ
jgi:hypothetical protein